MTPARWTERYLALLGLEPEPPGIEALSRIVHAHALSVPFENVTALLRRRDHPSGPAPAPDPEALLDAWERRSGGGVCFEICVMLSRLLGALGYRAHVVLGQISLPNGHQAMVVHLDAGAFLVDLGNGAPLFHPIPLGDGPVEIHRHGLSFRFRPGEHPDELIQDRKIDGEWKHHCRYSLAPAADTDRDAGYQHHLTPNASWVTGTLTIVRSTPRCVFALRDDALTRHTAQGKSVETISETSRFVELASEAFGLPHLPIEHALEIRAQFAELEDATSTRRAR